jgi:hypothetical protein
MTKGELFNELKSKLNETEFETLGITERTSKSDLQAFFDQCVNVTKEHEMTDPNKAYNDGQVHDDNKINKTQTDTEKDPELTKAAADGNTDDFDEILGKIKGAEPGQPKEKVKKDLITREKRARKKGAANAESFHIEGYILLLATDTVFPTMLSVVNNMIDKKHQKLKADDLRLSQTDFDKLEPLADQAAAFLSVQLNPVAGFFLVSAFMYANNMIAIKMKLTNGNKETTK